MNGIRFGTAVLLVMAFAAVRADAARGVSVAHAEPLERLGIEHAPAAGSVQSAGRGPLTLNFDALGRQFVVELTPNAPVSAAAAAAGIGANIGIYRGHLPGREGSWARIVVVDGVPSGLIWDGSELIGIENPADGLVRAAGPVAYRLADVRFEPGTFDCAVPAGPATGDVLFEAMTGEISTALQQAPGAVDELRLGAIGDYEFTSAQGLNAAAAILTRLNNVDGIYSSQIGVQITVPVVETFDDPSDPFSDTTASGTLLDELGLYREGSAEQRTLGLTHLYTGRDLDGSNVGIAYSDALCRRRFGAGLSEGNRGSVTDSLIAAHEIGHNFGAPHDGDPNFACAETPPDFIMAPSVNGSDQFSTCSISIMRAAADQASCIEPLPSVDAAVSATEQPGTVLLGNAATVTFDVTNQGTLTAVAVVVDVSLPANLSLISSGASQGSCTDGAGTVTCALGDLAGLASASVTVSARAEATGTAVVAATATTTDDADATNDSADVSVTVDPAVDLAVSTSAALSLALNESGNTTATIGNLSALSATGVAVSVALDDGLRADSAAWDGGTCTVAARQVDCSAASLAGGASGTLTLAVTGLAGGNKGYTLSVSSNEADANGSDNSVRVTVTVTDPDAPPASQDDGGSGAPGFLLIGCLFAAWIRRRL